MEIMLIIGLLIIVSALAFDSKNNADNKIYLAYHSKEVESLKKEMRQRGIKNPVVWQSGFNSRRMIARFSFIGGIVLVVISFL